MTVSNTSDKNLELLKLLTNSVRVMTASQAAIALGESEPEGVTNRLRRLKTKGLVELRVAWFTPPVLSNIPLYSWKPNEAPPDCRELARTAHRRWSTEPISETVAIATAEARNLYGAVGVRAPRDSELPHDLWVTKLFLNHYAGHPVYSWVHEDGFGDLFPEGSRPDASLVERNSDAKPIAVELLGNYRREKIEQFHNYCEEFGISYEIW